MPLQLGNGRTSYIFPTNAAPTWLQKDKLHFPNNATPTWLLKDKLHSSYWCHSNIVTEGQVTFFFLMPLPLSYGRTNYIFLTIATPWKDKLHFPTNATPTRLWREKLRSFLLLVQLHLCSGRTSYIFPSKSTNDSSTILWNNKLHFCYWCQSQKVTEGQITSLLLVPLQNE